MQKSSEISGEIMETIKKCAELALERKLDSFSPGLSLTDDLNMESIHLVAFQVEIEDAFQIEFDPLQDDFYEIFRTVFSVYQTVEKKLLEK